MGFIEGPVHAHFRGPANSGCYCHYREAHRTSLKIGDSSVDSTAKRIRGTDMICAQSLPFSKIQHEVASLDAQPSNTEGGILVLVSGRLLVRTNHGFMPFNGSMTNFPKLISSFQVDEEQRPMSYTQAFQLLPDGQGSYFVFNDVFRLVYGAS